MSTNPYLLWICGIENTVKDDPRFDIEARRKMAQENMGEFYIGELELPFVPDDSLGEIDENFDLLTGRYREQYKPHLVHELFYEGSPMGDFAWNGSDRPIGYIIAGSQDRYLLRGLFLVPGFEDVLATKGYVVLPQMNPDEERAYYHSHNRGGVGDVDLAIKEGRWISMYQPWQTDLWFRRALWLFNFAGWTGVTRDMLKLMMVFDWS